MKLKSIEYKPQANALQIVEDREGTNHRWTHPSDVAGVTASTFINAILPLPTVAQTDDEPPVSASTIRVITFNPENAQVQVEGRLIGGDNLADEAGEVVAFFNAVMINGGNQLLVAHKKLKELEDGGHN